MNNYPNFKNYNLYSNSNMYYEQKKNVYNQIDMNTKIKNELYDPYNGFIRGNLFKNIYDPFNSKEPYEIKPINDQAKLLTYLNSLSFAMTDLNLYLDINPNNEEVISLFNQYRKEKEKTLNEYEKKYGPITLNSNSLETYPWSWDDMPWPWDN